MLYLIPMFYFQDSLRGSLSLKDLLMQMNGNVLYYVISRKNSEKISSL